MEFARSTVPPAGTNNSYFKNVEVGVFLFLGKGFRYALDPLCWRW